MSAKTVIMKISVLQEITTLTHIFFVPSDDTETTKYTKNLVLWIVKNILRNTYVLAPE